MKFYRLFFSIISSIWILHPAIAERPEAIQTILFNNNRKFHAGDFRNAKLVDFQNKAYNLL